MKFHFNCCLRTAYLLICCSYFGCKPASNISEAPYSDIVLNIDKRYQDTKTEVIDNQIIFESDDKITLVCGNINTIELANTIENRNIFNGSIAVKHLVQPNCPFYAVYPALSASNLYGDVQYAELPNRQEAPFDRDANFMLSNVVIDTYDDAQMPSLELSMSQLMGLIKVRFINNDINYKDETLSAVRLNSNSTLAGPFTFSFSSGNSSVHFNDNGWKSVQSVFTGNVKMGCGVTHEVYLFVAPGTIDSAVLTIVTDVHMFTLQSTQSLSVDSGALTSFGEMDIDSFEAHPSGGDNVKTVVCWGDSFTDTGGPYPVDLSKLISPSWNVIAGGVSGNTVNQIAARQGSLGVYTSADVSLPSSTQSITTSGLLRDRDDALQSTLCYLGGYTGKLVNPCLVTYGTSSSDQILCNVVGMKNSDGTFYATFSRLVPGEEITIPANSRVESYGAREYRNADLQIIYMGENGGYEKIPPAYNEHYYDNLLGYHDLMLAYAVHSNDYIILALHDVLFNNSYWEAIHNRYGNRVINLHDDIPKRGRELLIRTGAYNNICDIPSSELTRIDSGEWPVCFMFSANDAHPSSLGTKAIAILIFEKMQELGYLD